MNSEMMQCANEPCLCEVSAVELESDDPVESYCSEDCREDADGEEKEACACGHAPCDAMN